MAKMHPHVLPDYVSNDSKKHAEIIVYNKLKHLNDEYRVFYSVTWSGLLNNGTMSDGETDFIVLHPQKGLLFIEVKGGNITSDPNTGKLYSIDKNRVKHEIKPKVQLEKSEYVIMKKIKKLSNTIGWIPKSRAVIFPHCRDTNLIIPQLEPEFTFFHPDLKDINKVIQKSYRVWDHPNDRELSEIEIQLMTDFLSSKYELKRSIGVDLAEGEKEILLLTEQQYKVFEMIKQQKRVAICGGAGTGKTLLALKRAIDLAQSNKKTLLVCYNRPLANHLNKNCGNQLNLEIKSYHQLCHEYGMKYNLLDRSRRKDDKYYTEYLPDIFIKAIDNFEATKYDAIIVDEGQDIEGFYWMTLENALKDIENGILYFFYDDHQTLYKEESVKHDNMSPVKLSTNYRNTKYIFDFAKPYYGDDKLKPGGPKGIPVSKIIIDNYECLARELNRIVHKLVKKEGIRERDVAILTGKSKETSILGSLSGLKTFPFRNSIDENSERVLYETVRKFKGLESPVVILTELENELKNKELMYVALTRARLHLIIVDKEHVINKIARE